MTWHGRCGTMWNFNTNPPKRPAHKETWLHYRSISLNRCTCSAEPRARFRMTRKRDPQLCASGACAHFLPFFFFWWHFQNMQPSLLLSEEGKKKTHFPSAWEWRDHVQHFWVNYASKDESSILVVPQSLLILFNFPSLFPKLGHYSCTVRHPFTTLGVFLICNNLPAAGWQGSTCVTTRLVLA